VIGEEADLVVVEQAPAVVLLWFSLCVVELRCEEGAEPADWMSSTAQGWFLLTQLDKEESFEPVDMGGFEMCFVRFCFGVDAAVALLVFFCAPRFFEPLLAPTYKAMPRQANWHREKARLSVGVFSREARFTTPGCSFSYALLSKKRETQIPAPQMTHSSFLSVCIALRYARSSS
jgi:hypothetical protein